MLDIIQRSVRSDHVDMPVSVPVPLKLCSCQFYLNNGPLEVQYQSHLLTVKSDLESL